MIPALIIGIAAAAITFGFLMLVRRTLRDVTTVPLSVTPPKPKAEAERADNEEPTYHEVVFSAEELNHVLAQMAGNRLGLDGEYHVILSVTLNQERETWGVTALMSKRVTREQMRAENQRRRPGARSFLRVVK